MKKNILIGVLVIFSGLSLSYAYIQKLEAEQQKALAEENKKIAAELNAMAIQAQAEANKQRRMPLPANK